MDHPEPGMDYDPESPPPPLPEERGSLIPPIRRPPTALGSGTADPFGMFGDRFRIERRLAWPSLWTAFLAQDLTQDRLVVLCLCSLAHRDPRGALHSALPAAHLDHPNILPLIEARTATYRRRSA